MASELPKRVAVLTVTHKVMQINDKYSTLRDFGIPTYLLNYLLIYLLTHSLTHYTQQSPS